MRRLNVLWFVVIPPTVDAGDRIEFNRDIRPILSSRCLECHGPDVAEAGLRLDQEASTRTVRESGRRAVVPGDAGASELIARVTHSDPEQRMPPAGHRHGPVSEAQVELLRRWIDQGAPWQTHWAFVPPIQTEIPDAATDLPRGPIDAFLWSHMQAKGLSPSPDAARHTLLRRISLDLIGLPPTVDEVEAFLRDKRPDALERVVDRLLASPHFGEAQASAWLDLVRYADTDGYALDFDRSIWPYRDWVVESLNADMPYDQFTIEQLAGDLLPDATLPQKIATAMHRNTRISTEAGSDPEEYRIEAVLDRVNTTGSVWLGLTVGCAQCHSHKFDPLTQTDYYRLFAYFNGDAEETTRDEAGVITNVSPRVVFHTPSQEDERAALESQLAVATSPEEQSRIRKRLEEIVPVQSLVMQRHATDRVTRVFHRGSFLQPGETVSPGAPAFLESITGTPEGTDRLALARWLVRRDNPLTARVAVNRLWYQHIGQAFVDTLDDFGSQAPPVRHGSLLDWLTVELMEGGWRLKRMHRDIVTSAVYRQDSRATDRQRRVDPTNQDLSRMNRLRLTGEAIRDNALFVGGVLSSRVGGRPVHSHSMKYLGSEDTTYRRSIYLLWKRSSLDPTLSAFDAPARDVTCSRRERTNTPIQSLDLLNDRQFLDAARGLARRLMEMPGGLDDRIAMAYRIVLSRVPTESEQSLLTGLWHRRRDEFRGDPDSASAFANVGAVPLPGDGDVAEAASWTLVASVLLNLEETMTRE